MQVTVIGFGIGELSSCLPDARKAIEKADMVIGSPRILRVAGIEPARAVAATRAEDICAAIESGRGENISVLMSGDSGFFSGTARLLQQLPSCEAKVLPGVGCVSYFSAALQIPWQDWHLCSAHGVDCNPKQEVANHRAAFFITGGENTVQAICLNLCEAGFGELWAAGGSDLGSKQEYIKRGTVKELADTQFSPLSVLLVHNPKPLCAVEVGMSDERFIRGDVPMTKSEVRAVCISKLRLKRNYTLFDIGAGTGSVSCEAALLMPQGKVYAIEREEHGCELIKANAAALNAFNVECVLGEAPEAFEELPPPDAAFIGGSGKRLCEIMELLLDKNPRVRVVITAVTLETLSEATSAVKRFFPSSCETVMISVSRAKPLGEYSLMNALNPVYIISGGGENA